MKSTLLKSYLFPLILLAAIIIGGFVGYFLDKGQAHWLKPIGDLFLNLILTSIVPLIFFSVASAIVKARSKHRLGKLLIGMLVVFLIMGTLAALYGLAVVKLFPPAQGTQLSLSFAPTGSQSVDVGARLTEIFSAQEFYKLFSHKTITALLIFSILIGLAATKTNAVEGMQRFLQAGEDIFMQVFSYIMYLAPIGFLAYFAVLISEIGPKLIESYLRVTLIYYISVIIYFFVAFTIYAYIADRIAGIKRFWGNVFLPVVTSIATCSSVASIPASLIATKKMHVSSEVRETAIPLGILLHKQGSIIGGIFKIAFLFGLFHLDFSGFLVLLAAVVASLLVGTVMGAIPSGGMLGELLILGIYGFPPSSLVIIAAISILIDPLATMLNVLGNNVSCLLIAKFEDPKQIECV